MFASERPSGSWRGPLFAVFLALGLGACVEPTPYQPLGPDGGFAQEQIEPNRFRLSFVGNYSTDRATVERYALYRAAEITVQQGADYFVVANDQTERDTYYLDDNFAYGPAWGYRRGYYSGFGVGVGVGRIRPISRYDAILEILTFHGRKPADDPQAYDAREVLASLGPGIQRPLPPSG